MKHAFTLALLTAMAVLAMVLHLGCSHDSNAYLAEIRTSLEAIPGVQVTDIVGNGADWPLGPTDAQAVVTVHGTGHVVLCALTPESFAGTKPFRLACIDGWVPSVLAPQDLGRVQYVAGCPDSVAIGAGSSFSGLFPFRLISVADVLTNYEAIASTVNRWPSTRPRLKATDRVATLSFWKYPCSHSQH